MAANYRQPGETNRAPADSTSMPSSVIKGLRYDEASRRLRVWFVSGSVYDYFAVPEPLARAFVASRSKGRFFSQHVRDRYDYEQVETGASWRHELRPR